MLLKRIEGYENYWISMEGRNWSDKTNNFLSPHSVGNYLMIQLNNKHLLIQRLLAKAYIDNPNNYKIVDHLYKNSFNNNSNNLKW
jgi:hypothetical protein